MSAETCFKGICFFALDPNTPKIFSFAELLSGMAIMILAWTIADVRYRFRINTAPFRIHKWSFFVVSLVGLATLLTDLWIGAGWYVLKGNLINTVMWQAMLAGIILATFFVWSWYAFIQPPKFGGGNAREYTKNLHEIVLRAKPEEMAVIADEIQLSLSIIIENLSHAIPRQEISKSQFAAIDIVQLMGDQRFCAAIVESSPSTILNTYSELRKHSYGEWLEVAGHFARNIMIEAIKNKNSFLYRESSLNRPNLIGGQKLITNAMFSDNELVEGLGLGLDALELTFDATPDQLEVYARCVTIFFDGYCKNTYPKYSSSLNSAVVNMFRHTLELYKVEGDYEKMFSNKVLLKTRITLRFLNDSCKILSRRNCDPSHERIEDQRTNIYSLLAGLTKTLLLSASEINGVNGSGMTVQRFDIWSEIFDGTPSEMSSAKREILFKLRRVMYDEILKMEKFSNFSGARIIKICLTAMGLTLSKDTFRFGGYALHKVLLSWLRKNFARIYKENHRVGEACLPENITYDKVKNKLVLLHPAVGLRLKERYSVFALEDGLSE